MQPVDVQAARSSPGRWVSLHRWLIAGPGFHWPEIGAAALFAAIVAAAIPFHEPWSDEAQAWQLARTLSLRDLFSTYIRYEASPGLWHFLLWIFIRLGVSYEGVHWICGAIAVVAVSLLIFLAPFPRYLRLLLPFTYFLLFQYAVIARSYVLVPLLLFLAAWFWKTRPIVVAVLLGLLANVSLHAAVISGGLAIVYLATQLRSEGTGRATRRTLGICTCILLAFSSFALWTAWPPHDLRISAFRGQSRSFPINAFGSLVLGTCEPWFLSVAFWIAVVLCFRARRKLLFLLPVLFFTIFSGMVYAQFWHMGLLVPLILSLMWITWPDAGHQSSRSEWAGQSALLALAIVQLLWSGYALKWDHSHAFSGDSSAAQFIAPYVQKHTRIDVTWVDEPDAHGFDAVGMLPYFDHDIFENSPKPFWWWSESNPIEARFEANLPSRPPIVFVEARLRRTGDTFDMSRPGFQRLTQAGYRLTHEFCGTIPERLDLGITSCHLIFEPAN
jgi:hypothetical protein